MTDKKDNTTLNTTTTKKKELPSASASLSLSTSNISKPKDKETKLHRQLSSTPASAIYSNTSTPPSPPLITDNNLKNKENDDNKVKRVLPPGACKTCVGVTFFTSLMDQRGAMPKCYGLSNISKPTYIPDDHTAEHAEKADAWTYICIGDSETMDTAHPDN